MFSTPLFDTMRKASIRKKEVIQADANASYYEQNAPEQQIKE